MKASESKTTTANRSVQQRSEQPFFQKQEEQGNSFFSDTHETPTPFFSPATIQPKLKIGQPGDQYEQEADAKADEVVQRLAMDKEPTSSNTNIPNIQAQCAACEQEEQVAKKEESIQRNPVLESAGEPVMQAKFTAASTPVIQREEMPEQEEEVAMQEKQVQMKPAFDSAADPLEDDTLQPKCDTCAPEGEQVMTKSDGEPAPSASFESRLSSSKGGGSSLPDDTRSQMEGAFGADFSGVRVHTDSSAVQMNKELGAQAFTHGSDIYFNTGKYDTLSSEGQHLLSHELTHTIQQGNSKISPKLKSVSKTNENTIQRGMFGNPWSGIKKMAGLAGKEIKSGVTKGWNFIKSLIENNIDFQKYLWEKIKEVASVAWDIFKKQYRLVVSILTTPLAILGHAIVNMDVAAVKQSWGRVTQVALKVWDNFHKLGNKILDKIQGFGNRISETVSKQFARIDRFLKSPLFQALPDFLKSKVYALINKLRILWNKIRKGIQSLFDKTRELVNNYFKSVRQFIDQILSFAINSILESIIRYGQLIILMRDLMLNPGKYVNVLVGKIASYMAPIADKFEEVVEQLCVGGIDPSWVRVDMGGLIQKKTAESATSEKKKKSSASTSEICLGILHTMKKKWATLDLGTLLETMVRDIIFPNIGNFEDINHLTKRINGIFERIAGSKDPKDAKTNFLYLLDIHILIYETVIGILMRSLMVPLIVASLIPDLLVKSIAGAVGLGLLAGFAAGAVMDISHKLYLLHAGLITDDEKEEAYNRIADSLIASAMMAVFIVVVLIIHFIAQVAKIIYNAVKARFFPPPEVNAKPSPEIKPPGSEPESKFSEVKESESGKSVEIDPMLRKRQVFERAKQSNKYIDELAKEYGKENDPGLEKLRESNDDILTKTREATPEEIKALEEKLNKNEQKLNELEESFKQEAIVKREELIDLSKRLKERAHKVADSINEHDNPELTQIAVDAENIEVSLKENKLNPETIQDYENTLNNHKERLLEIEREHGLISKYKYIEEYEPGKERLTADYAKKWRETFYPKKYNPSTYAEIQRLRTTPRSKGGWAHESNPNLIWDEVQGKFVDATLDKNTITVDHNPEAVVDHWNRTGHNSNQEARANWYRDPSNHKYTLKRYNSSDGGSKSGSFNRNTGPDFSGPNGMK